MYKLFLDDKRDPPTDGWIIVRDFDEFITVIKECGLPDFISFDHDLGCNVDGSIKKTGMDCAKWLVEWLLDQNLTLPDFVVHSMNPTGKRNIEGLLQGFKKFCEKQNI